mgnify:CR=1 FL=1
MARRQVRRETEIFSISFLDCITCGLGSVVLLLVLTEMRTPQDQAEDANVAEQITRLQDELIEISGIGERTLDRLEPLVTVGG